RAFHQELDGHPENVEIREMCDLAIKIGAPVAIDDLSQEQSRDHEEIRHPERLGKGHDSVQPTILSGRLLDAKRGMHHHDENDAESLAVVHPGAAPSTRLARHVHVPLIPMDRAKSIRTRAIIGCRCCAWLYPIKDNAKRGVRGLLTTPSGAQNARPSGS